MSRKFIASGLTVTMLFVFSVLPASVVHAATQTVSLTTTAASDDPHINGDVGSPTVSSLGVNVQNPLNNTTTPLDDASVMVNPHGYTWRLSVPNLCSGAELLSLRLISQTSAENEESTSGLFLVPYRTSNLTMLDSYTINGGNGEDSNTWVPAIFGYSAPGIDRGTGGVIGPFTTFPANAGMQGTLDGTWNISGHPVNEPIGVYVQHWMEGDTTTAQTTIESATLTYDDSGCNSASTTANSTNSDAEDELAGTGVSAYAVTVLAGALVLAGLSIRRSALSRK